MTFKVSNETKGEMMIQSEIRMNAHSSNNIKMSARVRKITRRTSEDKKIWEKNQLICCLFFGTSLQFGLQTKS